MNDTLQMLFEYDAWATARLLAALRHLSPEQLAQEFGPERTSVRQQFVHLVSVSDRARARLLREAVPDHVDPLTVFGPGDLITYEAQARERLWKSLASLPEGVLEGVRDFTTRSGTWRVSGADTLFQVVNHGTYHRGQIAMLLNLLGVPLPDTDFIVWRDERRGPAVSHFNEPSPDERAQ